MAKLYTIFFFLNVVILIRRQFYCEHDVARNRGRLKDS